MLCEFCQDGTIRRSDNVPKSPDTSSTMGAVLGRALIAVRITVSTDVGRPGRANDIPGFVGLNELAGGGTIIPSLAIACSLPS